MTVFLLLVGAVGVVLRLRGSVAKRGAVPVVHLPDGGRERREGPGRFRGSGGGM